MASNYFWIDFEKRYTAVFMTQLLPSASYPNRKELKELVNQSLHESITFCKNACCECDQEVKMDVVGCIATFLPYWAVLTAAFFLFNNSICVYYITNRGTND